MNCGEFQPTRKSPEMEGTLRNIFGIDRRESISMGWCTTCGKQDLTRASFKDELSIKEYQISGMCQKCQDEVYTMLEEAEER